MADKGMLGPTWDTRLRYGLAGASLSLLALLILALNVRCFIPAPRDAWLGGLLSALGAAALSGLVLSFLANAERWLGFGALASFVFLALELPGRLGTVARNWALLVLVFLGVVALLYFVATHTPPDDGLGGSDGGWSDFSSPSSGDGGGFSGGGLDLGGRCR